MELLTINQVAERLGVSRRVALQMVNKGDLPAANIASSADCKRPSWRVREDDLNNWIRSRMKRSSE